MTEAGVFQENRHERRDEGEVNAHTETHQGEEKKRQK
jgi:hypothetical protein